MGRGTVGVLRIDLTAGTADFISQLDRANAKITDFTTRGGRGFQQLGAHSVSSMQATSGAIRLFEGSLPIRSMERFIAQTLGMGDVIAKAFPLVGGIAFGSMIVEEGRKVYDFFKAMQEAPQKVSAAFREMGAPLRLSIDELRVANDRLQMDIDRLQGHRVNTLALTMDEARASTDKLFDSIEKTIGAMNKLLQSNAVTLTQRIGGMADDKDLRTIWGGESGFGGAGLEVAKQIQASNAKIDKAINDALTAKTPDQKARANSDFINARSEGITNATNTISDAIAKTDAQLKRHKELLEESKRFGITGISTPFVMQDEYGKRVVEPSLIRKSPAEEQALIEKLENAKLTGNQALQQVPVMLTNADLTAQKQELEAGKANAKPGDLIAARLQAMRDSLGELEAKLKSVGQTDAFRAQTEGAAAALKAIDTLNKELKESGRHVDTKTAAEIKSLSISAKRTEAEISYQTKLDSTTRALDNRIKSQKLLTAAIGQGYEATKRAAVETELMNAMGREYGDPTKAADQAALRARIEQAHDAEHADQVKRTIDGLQKEIELDMALAAVQRDGAEAVRQAHLAFDVAQAKENGATKEQIDLLHQRYAAQRQNVSAETVARLDEETAATKRLTAAIWQGTEAARQARVANEVQAAGRQGGTAVPGIIGVTAEQMATASNAQAKSEEQIATSAADRVNHYKNALKQINDQVDAIKAIGKGQVDEMSRLVAIRDLENERLKLLSEQALATGKLSDGLKAFFTEAKLQAEEPGKILKDGLTHATDGVAGALSRAMTGRKAEWGKTFQDIGNQMVDQSVKSLVYKGVDWVGHRFGLNLGGNQKPDFTQSKPGHVIVDNLAGSPVSGNPLAGPTGPAGSKKGGKLFGDGAVDDFIFSLFKSKKKTGDGGSQEPWTPPTGDYGGFKRNSSGLIDRTGATGPTGYPSDPVHVIQDGGQQQGNPLAGGSKFGSGGTNSSGIGDILGNFFSGFGGGAGGGPATSVDSSISFGDEVPGFAEGGVAPANQAYMVGEHGPEMRFDRTPGTIVPMDKISGGGDTHNWNIDARGADLGAAGRIKQALAATRDQAVSTALRAAHEQSKRSVQKSR